MERVSGGELRGGHFPLIRCEELVTVDLLKSTATNNLQVLLTVFHWLW